MKHEQPAAYRCECGCFTLVQPLSPWEFAWDCAACQKAGVIAWARASEPPSFTKAEIQVELFA